MRKSYISSTLITSLFLFSAWLNALHGYEYTNHEHGPEECEICFVLLEITDTFLANFGSSTLLFSEHEMLSTQTNYTFTTTTYFLHPRAPPQLTSPTYIS
jgi:hypothetical protein